MTTSGSYKLCNACQRQRHRPFGQWFHLDRSTKDGWYPICKLCRKEGRSARGGKASLEEDVSGISLKTKSSPKGLWYMIEKGRKGQYRLSVMAGEKVFLEPIETTDLKDITKYIEETNRDEIKEWLE